MSKVFENRLISQEVFNQGGTADTEYIECSIQNCNLFEVELTKCIFFSCTFKNCDLSMCKLTKTQLNNVHFEDCKLMGVNFSSCSGVLFEVNFKNCVLDFCSFEKLRMPNTMFLDCSMQGVDMTDTQLSKSVFSNTNLQGATFENTNLQEANLSTAHHFTISPSKNNLKKATFSVKDILGLLEEFGICIV